MPGRDRRRGDVHRPRVPPVARQRQPLRASPSRSSWPARWRRCPTRRYTYRFLFAPGTIGSLTWLSRNRRRARRGSGTGWCSPASAVRRPLVYKRTRHGRPDDRPRPRPRRPPRGGEVRDYSPYGYDERQFNALGFDLPVGRLLAHPARRVPGVPHVRGRPRLRQRRGAARSRYAALARDRRRPRERRDATSTSAPTASRSWASAGSTRRRAGSRPPTR